MRIYRNHKKEISQSGFTLVELLVASMILIITIVGILISYIRSLELAEMSRNSSVAINASRSRIEQMKNTDFAQIVTNFNNVTYTVPGFSGIGVSYVTTVSANLIQVTATFCWQQRNGRVVGEDKDLDGAVDAGEDTNGNGRLDSPTQIISDIYNL